MIDLVKNKNFWVAFILIVFLFFITFKPQTKADLVYFYPQTCLGSFVNPEKAQGEREVDNPDLINELNSAVYYSGFKEIYCGNFQGPIKEGEIKKVTLNFNWVITKELREKPIIESTNPKSLIEKIIPSKTIEIDVGTSDVPINETQNNTNTNDTLNNTKNDINSNEFNNTNTNSNKTNNTNDNESQTATSSYENKKKSEMSALSPNQSTNNQSEQSVLSPKKSVYIKFINFVFAQEETRNNTNNEETLNNTKTNETLNNTNTDKINTNGNESQTVASSHENINQSEESVLSQKKSLNNQPEQSVLSQNSSAPKTLFDIHYTLDGQNWNYLGSVNENNWQNLTFDIPVAEVSLRYGASPKSEDVTRPEVSSALLRGWLDISKIQIKINSLPDTDYYLYLESMWLEVEYVSKVEEITPEDTSILNKNLSLDQNFDYLKIIKIKGISNNKILAVLSKDELWFFDLIKEKQTKISDDIDVNFDIGIKVNHAFWLSKDRTKVYYMNLNSLTIKEKTLERGDFLQRIYLPFPDLNLTLVLEGNNFYFQIPQIGEVFSDENSIIKDNFIRVFGLNKLLNEEELNNLGYYEKSSE
jgi:hypothetical protein